jgi:hypothetical protein
LTRKLSARAFFLARQVGLCRLFKKLIDTDRPAALASALEIALIKTHEIFTVEAPEAKAIHYQLNSSPARASGPSLDAGQAGRARTSSRPQGQTQTTSREIKIR